MCTHTYLHAHVHTCRPEAFVALTNRFTVVTVPSAPNHCYGCA